MFGMKWFTIRYCLFYILESKVNLGLEEKIKIQTCTDSFACPGNTIQTCGCQNESIMYPIVIDASNIGDKCRKVS